MKITVSHFDINLTGNDEEITEDRGALSFRKQVGLHAPKFEHKVISKHHKNIISTYNINARGYGTI